MFPNVAVTTWLLLLILFKIMNSLLIKVIIGIVVAGTGVGLVAEAAKPGDALYAYKTGVNEKVRGLFVTTYVADVNHQVDLVEERLAEIDALVQAGELTPELAVKAQTSLLAQFETTSKALNDSQSNSLSVSQKAELAAALGRFNVALGKYKATLETLDASVAKATLKTSGGGGNGKAKSSIAVAADVIADGAQTADIAVEDITGEVLVEEDAENSTEDEPLNENEQAKENTEVADEAEPAEETEMDNETATTTEEGVQIDAEAEVEVDMSVE